MAHVVMEIAGRTYRMSCDDGEEQQLRDIAAVVEEKILAMRGSFGDIGEQRSIVMAAIALADETKSMRDRLASLEAAAAEARAEAEGAKAAAEAMETKTAEMLEQAATRLERLATRLKDGAPEETPDVE